MALPVRFETFTEPCGRALSQDQSTRVQSGGPPCVMRSLFSAEKAAQTYSLASQSAEVRTPRRLLPVFTSKIEQAARSWKRSETARNFRFGLTARQVMPSLPSLPGKTRSCTFWSAA